jgi:Thiamine pyrophosphate enzyme, C-terminal TPP binding domain
VNLNPCARGFVPGEQGKYCQAPRADPRHRNCANRRYELSGLRKFHSEVGRRRCHRPAGLESQDFPNPDYVALARACGGVGFKAEKPGELRKAIDQALKAEGPAIVDCVVPADELPNVPHVDLEKMENFAEAKIKEAILAVTSR